MLFFCSSLHAQFSSSDPLLHQTQHIPYCASLLSSWSILPRHCQSVVYFPAPVFRRLQVVGRRESWMSAQHPPYLPLTSDPPRRQFSFPCLPFSIGIVAGAGTSIEYWLKRLENWGIGDGICMDTCARAFAMMSGGRIRAHWKRACLAISFLTLLRFCRDGFFAGCSRPTLCLDYRGHMSLFLATVMLMKLTDSTL